MFGMGWSEMVIIGVVALIVVGPQELPGLFKRMGEFVGKARGMAREFNRAMEQAAQDSNVNEIQQTLKAASDPLKYAKNKATDFVPDPFADDPFGEKEDEPPAKKPVNKGKIDDKSA